MTELVRYEGGHGWHGDLYSDIARGIRWLEQNAGREPAPAVVAADRAPDPQMINYITNGGFEKGTRRWIIGSNSKRMKLTTDPNEKAEGRQSLRIAKRGGMPLDIVRRNVKGPEPGDTVMVSAMVKAIGAGNAWLKFFVWDRAGDVLIEDLDVASIRGTFDWKKVERTFTLPENYDSAAVQFWMVLDGTVWLDDVKVTPVDSSISTAITSDAVDR